MENSYEWYGKLRKPRWSPPRELFGPVWTILYLLIFISFGAVVVNVLGKQIPNVVLVPFVLNLFFNAAFTTIQFKFKNNYLAALDILLVLATLVWLIVTIYPYIHWVALVNIPYLLWVTFATILQLTVTYLNRNNSQK